MGAARTQTGVLTGAPHANGVAAAEPTTRWVGVGHAEAGVKGVNALHSQTFVAMAIG